MLWKKALKIQDKSIIRKLIRCQHAWCGLGLDDGTRFWYHEFPSWSLLNEDICLKVDIGGSSHMSSLIHTDRDSYWRHILSCFSLWWITGCRKNDHQYVVIRHCSRDLFDCACVTIRFFDSQDKDHREKKARYRFTDPVYENSIYCNDGLALIYPTSWAISIAVYFYRRFLRKIFHFLVMC